jgi:N-ethylmaleimide reductase
MATYYEQRASAGLIIAEATQVSPMGQGYLDTPGIHTIEQVLGWRRVTDAVHDKGGTIVLQLWHVGRISHVSLLPHGRRPVSSTCRRANALTFTTQGFEPASEPRALRADELPAIVAEYRQAAGNAMDAGFDGVEVHCANGYLLDQFLRDSINDRGDSYGGSMANRARFPLEVILAVAAEVGPGRTGVRISPVSPFGDAGQDSDPQSLHNYFIGALTPLHLAYIHVIEGETGGTRDIGPFDYAALKSRFSKNNPGGAWIVNNGYTREMALDAVAGGIADMVAFGRPFISNPDLVHRLKRREPLAEVKTEYLYGGSEQGYTDYPPLTITQPTA